jgi:hypothetical protein
MPFMVEGSLEECRMSCEGNYYLNEDNMTCMFREWCEVEWTAAAAGD